MASKASFYKYRKHFCVDDIQSSTFLDTSEFNFSSCMFYNIFYLNNKILSNNVLEINMEFSLINIPIKNHSFLLEHRLCEGTSITGNRIS